MPPWETDLATGGAEAPFGARTRAPAAPGALRRRLWRARVPPLEDPCGHGTRRASAPRAPMPTTAIRTTRVAPWLARGRPPHGMPPAARRWQARPRRAPARLRRARGGTAPRRPLSFAPRAARAPSPAPDAPRGERERLRCKQARRVYSQMPDQGFPLCEPLAASTLPWVAPRRRCPPAVPEGRSLPATGRVCCVCASVCVCVRVCVWWGGGGRRTAGGRQGRAFVCWAKSCGGRMA